VELTKLNHASVLTCDLPRNSLQSAICHPGKIVGAVGELVTETE